MDLEQQLRETYAERLGALEVTAGDIAAARRTGAGMRVRRRMTVLGVAAALAAFTLAGVLDSRIGHSTEPAGRVIGHWQELLPAPLSPRGGAQAVWTGHEVLVVGGGNRLCPPNADCISSAFGEGARDAAAYDPVTKTWRRVESSPVPVQPGDRLLAAGGFVVLRHSVASGRGAWFVLDPARNHWTRVDGPRRGVTDPSAYGSRIYGIAGRRVVVYDVARGAWSSLPLDPLRPALTQRVVTATPNGAVVTGLDSTKPNDGTVASVVLADVWDGRGWRRLPPTGQVSNSLWSWTAGRMVDPDPFTEDGGEANGWGHAYPVGGTLDLVTGAWSPLPSSMSEPAPGDWSVVASGRRWVTTYGHVYDVASGRVGLLSRPSGAPDYGVAAAWAGNRLLVFGGADSADGYSGDALTNRAWLWTP